MCRPPVIAAGAGPPSKQTDSARRQQESARHERTRIKTFAELGVAEDIAATLATHGITEPFPIQALAVPLAIKGHDLIGQARTGTGKTLAFTIPVLHRVTPGAASGKPQALVVVPTRELAVQVAKDVELAGGPRGTRVLVIYGGRSYEIGRAHV